MIEQSLFFMMALSEVQDGVCGINCENRKFGKKIHSLTSQVQTWLTADQEDQTIVQNIADTQGRYEEQLWEAV